MSRRSILCPRHINWKYKPGRTTFRLILVVLSLILLMFLMGFVFFPVEIPAWVPHSIHSILLADYSADPYQTLISSLKIELVYEAIQDRGTPVAEGSRSILPTLLSGLVPTVTPFTPEINSTPTEPFSTLLASQTASIINSPTPDLTAYLTSTATHLPGVTATVYNTPLPTHVNTSATPTPRITFTPTLAVTPSPSTGSPQPSQTSTNIPISTLTRTPIPTRTPTPTFTRTPTQLPTSTFTNTPRPSATPLPSPTRTSRPYPEPPTATTDPYP